jgi:hypothetical protein
MTILAMISSSDKAIVVPIVSFEMQYICELIMQDKKGVINFVS